MEHKDPLPLLELRALQEGLKKLALHAAHCQKLTLRVSRETQALYKLSHRAHPALQAILIDLAQYRPTLEVGDSKVPEAMRWGDEV